MFRGNPQVNFSTAGESYGEQTMNTQTHLFMRESQHGDTVRSPIRGAGEHLASELNSSGQLNNSSSNIRPSKSNRKTPTPSRVSLKQTKGGRGSSTPSRKKDVSWGKSPGSSQRRGKVNKSQNSRNDERSP